MIASLVGAPFVDDCLQSIKIQVQKIGAEVIVVACGSATYAERIEKAFPWVRVLNVTERQTIPRLRRYGVEAARSPVIAIIEEHCQANRDWLPAALRALEDTRYCAVGGPVADDSYKRLRDWVVYFIEYNGSMPPVVAEPAWNLNGANIAYRRQVLMSHLALLDQGYWEASLHPILLAAGEEFLSVPTMAVRHRGPFNYGYYLRQRFLFSRAFAGWRGESFSLARRALYLMVAPLLPFVLLVRIAQRVFAKRGRVDKLLLALPLILPALFVYVAGEWLGFAAGPGRALYEVE